MYDMVSRNMLEEVHGKNRASRLRLDIWHPECWTLEVTAATDAGLIACGVYEVEDAVKARVIAYGDDAAAIDELIAATRASPLTDSVSEMEYSFGRSKGLTAGNTTRELLVTYRSDNSIHDALVSRGLIPDAPIRIRDGREQWTVLVEGTTEPQERLEEVRKRMNADIRVLGTGASVATTDDIDDRLTERQREVFEIARQLGYYEWPRRTTAAELATEIGVAKATVLEHLRKAEVKLLNP
jgi:predicted DNA binding protein